MSNQPIDKEFLAQALFKNSGGRLDSESINAAMNGNTDAVLNKLNSKDREKIKMLLNDPKALNRLMSGNAVKQLLGKLYGNGR